MTKPPKKAQSDPDFLFGIFGACALIIGMSELWHNELVAGLVNVLLAGGMFMLAAGLRRYLIPAVGIGSCIGLSLGGNHPYSAAFAIAGGIIGLVIGYVHDLIDTPLPSTPTATSSENGQQ